MLSSNNSRNFSSILILDLLLSAHKSEINLSNSCEINRSRETLHCTSLLQTSCTTFAVRASVVRQLREWVRMGWAVRACTIAARGWVSDLRRIAACLVQIKL